MPEPKTETPSLAKGAALTPETWEDFTRRLVHHCRGEGVNEHYTADAVFLVQAKKIRSGLDRAFTDKVVAIDHSCESSHESPQKFWEAAGKDIKAKLTEEAQNQGEDSFLELPVYAQWDLLDELDSVTVTGWEEDWETLNFHFTKEAADAFIRRKKHDYPEGMRVYVDAQLYCWEFNTIKEAIMTGKLVFKD